MAVAGVPLTVSSAQQIINQVIKILHPVSLLTLAGIPTVKPTLPVQLLQLGFSMNSAGQIVSPTGVLITPTNSQEILSQYLLPSTSSSVLTPFASIAGTSTTTSTSLIWIVLIAVVIFMIMGGK